MIMKKIDISTNINGIKFSSCIMNASGILCCTEKELYNLMISSSGAVVTKSCTIKPRKGNLKPRYFEWKGGSINSMGLPNLGLDFYLDFLEKKNSQKPFLLSISGLSIEENYLILRKANISSNMNAIELNLSCPNLLEKDKILGYDFSKISDFLENLFQFYKKPLGVKLPPYFEDFHFRKMAFILNKYPISFVTCINSLPNGICIDINKESVVIHPKKGFGGIGGFSIKPFALANVRKFYTYLRKDIPIIGCGGICTGKDVFEYILCGASAVQIGTQFLKEGIPVFDRLIKELITILKNKNYSSLNNFKGKLNVF
ncbi:dihydroorotate dehydrogenase [Blattabacterium punctulatus CPU2]|uniref:dihydroorotate oxidase (fumarate) n=1 Tax=Blattabacterium punctulatus CPU2 TaxID=1457032 RepID=A0AAD1FR09_9FLAO|nr:dihydroorotate oxidase [Blattabacterium punctulatus]AWU39588.1 dihydroorotate oxidase [Blattabacterium punctulatus]BBA17633.1 dihydroorotate dehydrogenase [Blattabacterium punctulatus CPU2]